jgi:hypothetical protein
MKYPVTRLLAGTLPVLCLSLTARADITSPLDIAGHVLWLDGDDLDGNGVADAVADGTAITDWVDKSSGQGVNTVTTTNGVPTVETAALGTHSAVHFAIGSQDKMDNDTFVVSGDYTVFTVVLVDSSAGSGHVLSGLNTAGTDTVLYRNGANLRLYSGQATGNTDVVVSPLADPLNPFLLGYQVNSGGAEKGFFQKTVTSFESNGSADLQGIRIGNLDRADPSSTDRNEGLGGFIAQVIIYDRALTEAETLDVVNYLDARFNLTGGPVGGPITSPLELSGHVLWLEGDDFDGNGTPDTGADDTPITEWVDKSSGQGVNSVTVTGGAPTKQFGAVGTHHAVKFAGGSEDKMDSDTLMVGSDYAVFTVVQPNAAAGSGHVMSGINGDSTDAVLYRTGDGGFRFYSGVTTGGVDTGLGQRLGAQNFLLFGYQINSTGSDIGFYKNQRILFEGNGSAALNGLRVGNLDRDTPSSTIRPEAFDGQIAEVIIYERALTATEIQQVYDYLKLKYDLEAVLPHPDATGAMTQVETGMVTGGSPSTLSPDSEAVTSGRTNYALGANGGTAFSLNYIGPGDARDFRAYRANDGFYADGPEGPPPVDEPWIAASAASYLGVKFSEPVTLDRIGLENQFADRRNAVLFFEYTTDDLSDVAEDADLGLDPIGVDAKNWQVIDVLELNDESDTRHLYSFPSVSNVTAMRLRIQSTRAQFAVTEVEAWGGAVAPPAEDLRIVQFDRASATSFTLGWTSVIGGKYRFETSTTLAPGWVEYQEAAVPKEVTATQTTSQTTLTLDPSAAPVTYIRVKRVP